MAAEGLIGSNGRGYATKKTGVCGGFQSLRDLN